MLLIYGVCVSCMHAARTINKEVNVYYMYVGPRSISAYVLLDYELRDFNVGKFVFKLHVKIESGFIDRLIPNMIRWICLSRAQ